MRIDINVRVDDGTWPQVLKNGEASIVLSTDGNTDLPWETICAALVQTAIQRHQEAEEETEE